MAALTFEFRFQGLMEQINRQAAHWSDEKCDRMIAEWELAQALGLEFVEVVMQKDTLIAVPSEEALRFWEDRGVFLC